MLDEVYANRENSLRSYDEMIMRSALLYAQARKDLTNHDIYDAFRKERVRISVTQEDEMPITTNKIKTIVMAWRKEMRVDLNTQWVIIRLTEEFGEPVNGKEWPMIKVFGSDESVADWDANHS